MGGFCLPSVSCMGWNGAGSEKSVLWQPSSQESVGDQETIRIAVDFSWLKSMVRVSFSVLTLLVGQHQRQQACRKRVPIIPKSSFSWPGPACSNSSKEGRL